MARVDGGLQPPPVAEHVAHFYADDGALSAAVVEHVVPVLSGDGAAILIATPAHRDRFSRALGEAGIDLAAVADARRLVVLDARATLDGLMVDGVPDAEAFDAHVGSVVRQAACPGEQVAAFGEMVALLWDAGEVVAALELERLWNALGDVVAFSLLCGYQSRCDENVAALAEVCELHTRVSGERFAASYPADPRSVPVARRAVLDYLRHLRAAPMLLDDVALAVGEAITNVVVHAYRYRPPGEGAIAVAASVAAGELRVTVRDGVCGLRARSDSPGLGLGLAIIDTLADGVDLATPAADGGFEVRMRFGLAAEPG
ncbi:MAG: ATP-binding protein [Solirubrobacteraceae bacterium]